ncbi:hypothetical protein SAMN05518849_10857 [Sphingobium sp. AP50]|nr:hypothetical protein SAMN05518849_10857 [Sphingobium sp. AP50]
MIRMAVPTQDPRTGIYIFRRVVPKALRPFFDGGKSEYKRSLDTRDPETAKSRYPAQADIYEMKLAAARRALLNQHLQAATAMVDTFLEGYDDNTLRGIARKLASLESEAFSNAHGLMRNAPGARYDFGTPPALTDLKDHLSRQQMLESVPDLESLPWLETIRRVSTLPSLDPIDWAIASIAYQAGADAEPGSELHEAIGRAYLDRLCAACAVRIEPSRSRIIPAPIIIVGGAQPATSLAAAITPSKVAPTITAVYDDWSTFKPREPKLLTEWATAVRRFVALNGDLPVDQITAAMLRDYRRTCAGLPSRARKDIASLPLRDQVEAAKAQSLPTLAADTVNKALSGLRVMLDHAVEVMEAIEENVGKTVTSLPRDGNEDARLPFEPDDLKVIFSAPLPEKSGVSVETLFWLLLLAPFTGCRLEELGTLRPGNIREFDGIPYIAIERDRRQVREREGTHRKRVKTSSSLRHVPLHPLLIEAGFLDLVERRRAADEEWLFSDLETNKYGSRTQRLSRVFNDFLDGIGLSDPELVFYSFRHTGKRALRGKVIGEIVDLLFGHADNKVSSTYGRGADMQTLYDAIVKISYPSVDWDSVIARIKAL